MTRLEIQPAILVELLYEDSLVPRRATEGSAGYDLHAYVRGRTVKCSDGSRVFEIVVEPTADTFELPPAVTALVPLGFKARLPHGYEAQVRPRSGTTFRRGLQIPNAPGTVDADFPDEWMCLVRNPGTALVRIEHGERIAQMVLHRFEVLDFEFGQVTVSTSRAGGFGSTGA